MCCQAFLFERCAYVRINLCVMRCDLVQELLDNIRLLTDGDQCFIYNVNAGLLKGTFTTHQVPPTTTIYYRSLCNLRLVIGLIENITALRSILQSCLQ